MPDPGLSADVHLGSALTSAVDGLFHRPDVQAVDNVMILTKDVPPGTPPSQAVTVRTNVDFPTYLKVAEEAAKAKNPKVTAIRIKRPPHPPEFAADARGFLVAIVRDLEIDAPAPDPKSQAGSVIGVPAKVLRLKIPQLETAISYQVETPAPFSHRVKGKIEEFNPSPTSQVLAINDDESKAQALTRFSGALVLSALATRIRSQPINTSLDNLNLPGFAIQSISPLDPSGWVRVNLVRTVRGPGAGDGCPRPVMSRRRKWSCRRRRCRAGPGSRRGESGRGGAMTGTAGAVELRSSEARRCMRSILAGLVLSGIIGSFATTDGRFATTPAAEDRCNDDPGRTLADPEVPVQQAGQFLLGSRPHRPDAGRVR